MVNNVPDGYASYHIIILSTILTINKDGTEANIMLESVKENTYLGFKKKDENKWGNIVR